MPKKTEFCIDTKMEDIIHNAWVLAGELGLRCAGLPLESFKLILALGGITKYFEDVELEDLIQDEAEHLFNRYRTGIPDKELR
jgi:hypothetical protein